MTTGHLVDEGPGLSRGSSELPSRVTTITPLATCAATSLCQQMLHRTATSVRLGHSPRPHPTVGYITIGANSSDIDTTGNSTGRYASSARRQTHAHINTLSHTHKPNVTLTILHNPTTFTPSKHDNQKIHLQSYCIPKPTHFIARARSHDYTQHHPID
jgi:hypothetical protein